MVLRRLMLVLVVLMFCRSGSGDEPLKLDAALGHISADARALVLVDTRMYDLIAPDLSAYVRAARPGGNSRSPCCRSWGWTIAGRRKSAEAIQGGTRPGRRWKASCSWAT